jgi:hypothetical protein
MARENPIAARVVSLISVLLIRYLKSPDGEAASIESRLADANFRSRKNALIHSTTAMELKYPM